MYLVFGHRYLLRLAALMERGPVKFQDSSRVGRWLETTTSACHPLSAHSKFAEGFAEQARNPK
jgi:hypothetical protein